MALLRQRAAIATERIMGLESLLQARTNLVAARTVHSEPSCELTSTTRHAAGDDSSAPRRRKRAGVPRTGRLREDNRVGPPQVKTPKIPCKPSAFGARNVPAWTCVAPCTLAPLEGPRRSLFLTSASPRRKKNDILTRDVCQKAAEAEALLQRAERNRAAAVKSQEAADAAGKALVVVTEAREGTFRLVGSAVHVTHL